MHKQNCITRKTTLYWSKTQYMHHNALQRNTIIHVCLEIKVKYVHCTHGELGALSTKAVSARSKLNVSVTNTFNDKSIMGQPCFPVSRRAATCIALELQHTHPIQNHTHWEIQYEMFRIACHRNVWNVSEKMYMPDILLIPYKYTKYALTVECVQNIRVFLFHALPKARFGRAAQCSRAFSKDGPNESQSQICWTCVSWNENNHMQTSIQTPKFQISLRLPFTKLTKAPIVDSCN